MYNSTRIFISSTAQAELQDLRLELKQQLIQAGHQPLLFEQDFGLWSDDALMDCLKKVEESEVYILFLSNRAGSFTKVDPNMTATYAEFDTALSFNKVVIPFVEKHIFEFFSELIKEDIDIEIASYRETHDIEPRHTYEIVKKYMEKLEKKDTNKLDKIKRQRVDDYIWAFIYDVRTKTNWTYTESLANTQSTCKFVKESLSQVLKELSPYYAFRKVIDDSTQMASRFSKFKLSIPSFTSCIKGGVLETKSLLYNLSFYLTGGDMYHDPTSFNPRLIARVASCDAISLYKKQNNLLCLLEYIGRITPEEKYELNDQDSFVSCAYAKENEELEYIFYHQGKQRIYMTKKIDDLVLSCHFSLSESWSEQRVKGYEEQILYAIMNERDQFDLAVDLLGGMLNEKR